MDWFWHDQIKISVNLNAQFECNVGEVKDCVIQGIVGKIKEFIGQELRSLRRSMIEIIKEIFPPKTGMQKATSLQGPGYVETVNTLCMVRAKELSTVYVDTDNFIVYHSLKSLNYMKI